MTRAMLVVEIQSEFGVLVEGIWGMFGQIEAPSYPNETTVRLRNCRLGHFHWRSVLVLLVLLEVSFP